MDPLGTLLVQARRQQKRGLREQADALGVSVVAISAWESGRERPARGDVPGILDAYGITRGTYVAAAIFALLEHPVQPRTKPRTKPSDLAFVIYAHRDGAADCPCNDCRSAQFHENRCPACDGSGLRPGFDD